MKHFLGQLILLFLSSPLFSQVILNNISDVVTEDFDALPESASNSSTAWVNDATLADWFAQQEDPDPLNLRYGGSRGTGNSSVSALYSFGNNDGDKALGAVVSSSSGDISFGLAIQNNTGTDIASMSISYTGEQWRVTNSQQFQILNFSYEVLNAAPSESKIPERQSGFTYVPELSFVSPRYDSTGLNLGANTGTGVNGNSNENRTDIDFTFNVNVPDGDYIFLRWYYEDSPKIDFGLGIDDLSVSFSGTSVSTLTFNSNHSLYEYISGAIDLRIPDDEDTAPFEEMTSGEMTSWNTMIENLLNDDIATVRTQAGTLGYDLVNFIDVNDGGESYYVLRHNGGVDNPNYWGTYVINSSPSAPNLNISVPHPVHDSFTGRQGAYMFQESGAYSIELAGQYRCSSLVLSGCSGSSSVCGVGGFTESDAAHADSIAFQFTAERIADFNEDAFFVQLHGFGHEIGDPDMIVSNGTTIEPNASDRVNTFVNSVSDFPGHSFTPVGVHTTPYTDKLTGFTNTLGRHLNNHQDSDFCEANDHSDNVTDRFIHVEQRMELRNDETNYPIVLNAIMDANAVTLPLDLLSFEVKRMKANQVLMNWLTSDEFNVSHFSVEESKNGVQFSNSEIVQAIGSGNNNYSTVINSNSKYFRLRIIDFDGHFEYSNIKYCENMGNIAISIFPNPNTGIFQVLSPADGVYELLNTYGTVIQRGRLDAGSNTIQVQDYRGMLILRSFGKIERIIVE